MMIKLTTAIALLCAYQSLRAQNDSIPEIPFNRWSLELNAGQNKAIKPFSEGYYSSNPENYFNFSGVNHFDLGVRFMLSETFGLKLDGAYDLVESQSGNGSLPFKNEVYRIGVQGVVNIGQMLRFDRFTKRFGILAHGGVQVSRFVINSNLEEDNGGIMIGLTPQVKLTRWCALTGDFTFIGNIRQHLTWDGQYSAKDNNLSGSMIHTSLGLTFYFGKKENHADWYVAKADEKIADQEARKRLDDLETMLNDTDKDGVPDYLDRENNTPNGVAVDSKGRYLDHNNNGVPDELESQHGKDGKNTSGTSGSGENKANNAVAMLLENGSYNVFYDSNKDVPDTASSNSIYQIMQYLKKQPDSRIALSGYADITGNEKANKDLSLRRAQKLKALFVAAGIAANRIEINGSGADTELPPTGVGLRLARRVTITLIR